MKINLGPGFEKFEDYIGIDKRPTSAAEIIWDLEEGLPFIKTESVEAIRALAVLEHIQNHIFLIEECWRVLKVDGEMEILVPYKNSPILWDDPTHLRSYTEKTFRFFDKKFHKGEYIAADYNFNCNFKTIYTEPRKPDVLYLKLKKRPLDDYA